MASPRFRTVAGLSFMGAGTVLTLGFVTAAALFPGYSMAHDTISALGAAEGTAASNLVFNGAMILAGILAVVAAYALYRVSENPVFTGVVAVTAVGGYIGVGVFPAQTGLPHFLAAMIAFVGTGIAALVTALVVRGPFRSVAFVLGVAELIALLAFVALGGANPLGVGGLERWVAYLGVVWAIGFGGYLLSADAGPTWSGRT
ncbi:MAG: DUF998 domain-containing protein [Halobacteriaceae archaeon]